MHKMNGRVRYSECAADNKMTLAAIINYFQDCTSENSELLGVGAGFLKERRRAWVINSWQVEVYRYPECSEEIEISTWATGFKGVFGPRSFCMKAKDGEVLALANTLWVYIDTETGRPVKPEEVDMAPYEVEAPLEMEKVSRKITLPEEAEVVDTFKVHKYHIDTNNHVNNCQYVRLAMEALPTDFRVTKLRVEYKKAAVYGDEMILKFAKEEERLVAELCDVEGKPYAIVEFIGEN